MVFIMQCLEIIVVDEMLYEEQGWVCCDMNVLLSYLSVVSVKADTIFSFSIKLLTNKQTFFIIVNW